jgi:hypothetical protein
VQKHGPHALRERRAHGSRFMVPPARRWSHGFRRTLLASRSRRLCRRARLWWRAPQQFVEEGHGSRTFVAAGSAVVNHTHAVG